MHARPRSVIWMILVAAAVPAGWAPQAGASLAVQPVVLEGRAGPPGSAQSIGPVLVSNMTGEPLPVTIRLVGLTHNVDGVPIFLDDVATVERVESIVRPSWRSATLPPGATRALWFSAAGDDGREGDEQAGGGAGGEYLAAFVEAPVPTGVLRVAVLLLLSPGEDGSRAGAGTARLEAAWLEQEAPGQPLHVVARVRNDGVVHAEPSVEASIQDPAGRRVAVVRLGPAVVLPGAVRHLRAQWAPDLLPPGRYTLRAAIPHGCTAGVDGEAARDPGPGCAEVATFEVLRPYELARLDGAVELSVGTSASGTPVLQASLHNRGMVVVAPKIEVRLESPSGTVARGVTYGPPLAPGGVSGIRLPWPDDLRSGEYRVTVTWLHGGRHVAEATLPVSVTPALARRPDLGGPGETP